MGMPKTITGRTLDVLLTPQFWDDNHSLEDVYARLTLDDLRICHAALTHCCRDTHTSSMRPHKMRDVAETLLKIEYLMGVAEHRLGRRADDGVGEID
jgi:hypothetical protein